MGKMQLENCKFAKFKQVMHSIKLSKAMSIQRFPPPLECLMGNISMKIILKVTVDADRFSTFRMTGCCCRRCWAIGGNLTTIKFIQKPGILSDYASGSVSDHGDLIVYLSR